jgi:hypothetical protein
MKLYQVPRNTWVAPVDTPKTPPGAPIVVQGERVLFKRCDGMYSYCINEKGFTVHLPAWEDVSIEEEPM